MTFTLGIQSSSTCKRALADPLIDHKTVTNRTVSRQLGGEALRGLFRPCPGSGGPFVSPVRSSPYTRRAFAEVTRASSPAGRSSQVGQRPHGVGQAVRLVRGSAIRVGRQKRRIRLDQQLVGGYQGSRLAQLAGVAEADRPGQAQIPAGVDAGRAPSPDPTRSSGRSPSPGRPRPAARRAPRRRRRGCGSSAACRCAWPGRCARRTPRAAVRARRSRPACPASTGPSRSPRRPPRADGPPAPPARPWRRRRGRWRGSGAARPRRTRAGPTAAAWAAHRAASRSSAIVTTRLDADRGGPVEDRPHVVGVDGTARVQVGVRVDQRRQRLRQRRRLPVRGLFRTHRHTIRWNT